MWGKLESPLSAPIADERRPDQTTYGDRVRLPAEWLFLVGPEGLPEAPPREDELRLSAHAVEEQGEQVCGITPDGNFFENSVADTMAAAFDLKLDTLIDEELERLQKLK